jgi:hypothetical protein
MPANYGLLSKAGTPTDGVDEVETLTVDATAGTYTLTFGGQTTSAIAFDATAAQVKAALIALSTIGAGNINVTGNVGGPYTITFTGSLSGLPQTDITADSTNLTGNTHTALIAQATGGVRGDYRGVPVRQPLIDTTNRKIYENRGTAAKPVWTEVSVV